MLGRKEHLKSRQLLFNLMKRIVKGTANNEKFEIVCGNFKEWRIDQASKGQLKKETVAVIVTEGHLST